MAEQDQRTDGGTGADEPAQTRSSAVFLPSSARHTVREFLFQLATITAGILIALSIDGVVELSRQRSLVREARAAIAVEITENLADLEGTLPSLEQHYNHLRQALRFADDLLSRGTTEVNELQFPLSIPSLNRASWQTAERTGALAYMDYAEVQEYSELYDLQDLVVVSQRARVGRLSDLSAIVYAGEGGDPHKSRPPDLQTFRTRVLDEMGALAVHRSLVEQLVKAYKAMPGR